MTKVQKEEQRLADIIITSLNADKVIIEVCGEDSLGYSAHGNYLRDVVEDYIKFLEMHYNGDD